MRKITCVLGIVSLIVLSCNSQNGGMPRMAKQFLTHYQDPVTFGKDAWNPEEYYTYFRVLETDDEYFPYDKRCHAFRKMYGLNLYDQALRKLYCKNALNNIPNIDTSHFKDL